jgi:hypothetical protein
LRVGVASNKIGIDQGRGIKQLANSHNVPEIGRGNVGHFNLGSTFSAALVFVRYEMRAVHDNPLLKRCKDC